MISNGQHDLRLGDFGFVNEDGEAGWTAHVYAADASFGNPQPILAGVRSLLRDGTIVQTQGHDNREAYFLVEITGPDLGAVADGEAALVAEVGKRNFLTWTPPDGVGAPTAFDVVTSSLEHPFDDMGELMLKRVYGLRLTCLPFSRSVDQVVVGSAFASDSIVIADDCESTAGWSQTGATGPGMSPTFSVDSTAGNFVTGTGAILIDPQPGPVGGVAGNAQYHTTAFRKALSINASGGGYLTFALRSVWNIELNHACYMTTSGGGKQAITSVSSQAIGNGFTRYAVAVTNPSTITELELSVNLFSSIPLTTLPPLWVDSIGLAANSTGPQQARSFDVLGSARTEGSLAISAVAGLGDVVLYTAPDRGDGFRPDLRRWQAVGTSSADATAVTGSYLPLSAVAVRMDAPAGQFRPGAYAVLARVKSAGSSVLDVTVSAQVAIGGAVVGTSEVASSGAITVPIDQYEVVRVGILHLPPTLVQQSLSTAVVRFSVTTGYGSTRLDELMVFPMEDSALTWVECGTGSPSATVASRLWVDGPSLEYPRGRTLVGNDTGGLDAYAARPNARGSHLLYPGEMFVYLMTSAAGGASLQTTYYPAWHTHAGS